MTVSRTDYVVIHRRPNGTPIHTTRGTLEQYGWAAVMEVLRQQLRSESATSPPKETAAMHGGQPS